jgi:hypothetical protein
VIYLNESAASRVMGWRSLAELLRYGALSQRGNREQNHDGTQLGQKP